MILRLVTRLRFCGDLYSVHCHSAAYRCFSIHSDAIVYSDYGDPRKVLRRVTHELSPQLKNDQVLVKLLAAPINPADINMIQGVYPVKPDLPAVGGNEGVAEVVEVGSSVTSLKKGDWVIPGFSGWGTWKTYAICQDAEMIKIPNDIPLISAATIAVNPCTAFRMLTDFEQLSTGDVVIQNGANSGVGQAVIQIAAELSLKTVNIVRPRPDLDSLTNTLKSLGATHVVTDEFIRTPEMKELMRSLPKPKLGLNCVGGKQVADILKFLDKKASLVTYGGMSKQPLMVPTGNLIFNDVKLRGYWMTQWNKDHINSVEMQEMWKFIGNAVRKGSLRAPVHMLVPFEQFAEAVSKSMEPMTTRKQILIMDSNAVKG